MNEGFHLVSGQFEKVGIDICPYQSGYSALMPGIQCLQLVLSRPQVQSDVQNFITVITGDVNVTPPGRCADFTSAPGLYTNTCALRGCLLSALIGFYEVDKVSLLVRTS
jgi:hypothetical protein